MIQYDGAKLWNSIPRSIKTVESLKNFSQIYKIFLLNNDQLAFQPFVNMFLTLFNVHLLFLCFTFQRCMISSYIVWQYIVILYRRFLLVVFYSFAFIIFYFRFYSKCRARFENLSDFWSCFSFPPYAYQFSYVAQFYYCFGAFG